MFIILQILIIILEEWATGTVTGLTYMDKIELKAQQSAWPREDPCKPLYWYPRHIPEYCHYKIKVASTPGPLMAMPPIPISVPLPQGVPMPMLQIPHLPYPPMSYQNDLYYRKQIGMVPGLPGLVSPDGGLNILPFSDAYSDILENHKQKMLRKRIRKLIDVYEDYSSRRRLSKKHKRRLIKLFKHT